jgi:hypothetical protein
MNAKLYFSYKNMLYFELVDTEEYDEMGWG